MEKFFPQNFYFQIKLKQHKYYSESKVVCSCGKTYTTGSTKEEMRIELCGSCHPFYTGEQKIVDTEGRVERLKRRYNLS